jgi:hypothetical protein
MIVPATSPEPARVRPYSDQPCWYPETDYEVAHYDTEAALLADKDDPDDEDPVALRYDKPCWVRQCRRPGCTNMDDGDGTFSVVHYPHEEKPADDYDCGGHRDPAPAWVADTAEARYACSVCDGVGELNTETADGGVTSIRCGDCRGSGSEPPPGFCRGTDGVLVVSDAGSQVRPAAASPGTADGSDPFHEAWADIATIDVSDVRTIIREIERGAHADIPAEVGSKLDRLLTALVVMRAHSAARDGEVQKLRDQLAAEILREDASVQIGYERGDFPQERRAGHHVASLHAAQIVFGREDTDEGQLAFKQLVDRVRAEKRGDDCG